MLDTIFLGLKMKTPVMVAAGPWSKDGKAIRRALEAGAGAVITESIISDIRPDMRPNMAYDGSGVQNIHLYSDIQIEGWEREMEIAKRGDGIVIASVSGHTPSELAYLASKMEKFGADGIEVSVSNPMGENLEVIASNPQVVSEITKEVVSNVKIPVMVKLSQNTTNISQVAKAVKQAGGWGVSAINSIRCILGVDTETCRPTLATYGGYSGPPIRPLGLASVATLAQSVDLPVCGIGGVETYRHVLEYIMLGASAVQVGSALLVHGSERITEIVAGLEQWAEEKGIRSVEEIRGKALNHLKSFDEMIIEPAISTARGGICTGVCQKCIEACVYNAIQKLNGEIKVNRELCTGCGFCTFICPEKKLNLEW